MKDLEEKYTILLKKYKKEVLSKVDIQNFEQYNEVLFSAHSCAIEGNSFTVDETRELKEKGLNLKLHNKSLFEAYEIIDHFNAYNFMMTQLNQPFTEIFLKKTHALLMKNTLLYRTGETAGEYTNKMMTAGDTIFGDPKKNIQSIPKLLKQTQKVMEEQKVHPVIIAASFHKFFIYLHPFRDGNGRLGRLLSNWILTKLEHPQIIIKSQDKQYYIDALKSSHKHKDNTPIQAFFFETSIAKMKDEIHQKKNGIADFEIK